MNLGELWTGILDLVAQVIIPVWNDLIAYIPLLLVLLPGTLTSGWETAPATP